MLRDALGLKMVFLNLFLKEKDFERLEPRSRVLQFLDECARSVLCIERCDVFQFTEPCVFNDGEDELTGLALGRFVGRIVGALRTVLILHAGVDDGICIVGDGMIVH